MDSLLSWFNGKKTIIGGIALWLVSGIEMMGLESAWVPQVVTALSWIGMIFLPAGVGHKVIKNEVAKPTPGK